MEQVWFPGVHSDVGGGYPQQDLSGITLEWMVKKAKADGLKIYSNHKVKVDPKADGVLHDSGSGIARLFTKKQRTGHAAPYGAGAVPAGYSESLAARTWDDNGELGWLTGPNNRDSKGGRK